LTLNRPTLPDPTDGGLRGGDGLGRW